MSKFGAKGLEFIDSFFRISVYILAGIADSIMFYSEFISFGIPALSAKVVCIDNLTRSTLFQ